MYKMSHKYQNENLKNANPINIDYLVRFERQKEDVFRNVPCKIIEKFVGPWGEPHGSTIPGSGKAFLNDLLDQTPGFKGEVYLHEGDHCPVELTTRYISRDRNIHEPRESIIYRINKLKYY